MKLRTHLQAVPGRDDVVHFRTHANSDLVVFQVVFGVGAVVATYFLGWPAGAFAASFLLFATWVRGHRTTVDLRARTFVTEPPWVGARVGPLPVEKLSVRKSVKRSKGTVTVTFEVSASDVVLANGLPWLTAKELVEELAGRLGVAPPEVPE